MKQSDIMSKGDVVAHRAVKQLRAKGFAVVIWYPEEVEAFGTDARSVEGLAVEYISEALG